MIDVPRELAERPQWLVWKYKQIPGEKKPRKIPYYSCGTIRNGAQGSDKDRSQLAPLEIAIKSATKYDGPGFAFLPGDGLVGIDLDDKISGRGEVSDDARRIIDACCSYTELSPSGAGIHIIARGKTESFKDNGAGIEVFCGSQYFTVTGKHLEGTPKLVNDLPPAALELLRGLVKEGKDRKREPKNGGAKGSGSNQHQVRSQKGTAPTLASRGISKLESALAHINPDCGYDEWIRIGMAIHAEMGDSGFSAWDHWSGKGSKYPGSRALEGHWKSFDSSGGVTAATIYKQAQDAGWRAPVGSGATRNRTSPKTADDLPEGETALELVEADVPEPRRRCDPWATEGLNLFVSRPKLGKTTLLRQKAAALAVGGEFLGEKCEQTASIFLSLEEGRRLMRMKLKAGGFSPDALSAIRIFYEWPRGREGVDQLDRMLEKMPYVGYVVIDCLTRFRTVPDKNMPAFIADYEAMQMLQALTTKWPGLVVDVIHHTRKAKSDDPIDDISGTYGLTAACDSYTVLRWHEDGAVMHVGGRLWDREESDYKLRRGNHRWELAGAHTGLTSKQEQVLGMVRAAGKDGIGGSTVADKIGRGKQAAWEHLDALVAKGFAVKRDHRVYLLTNLPHITHET